MLKTWDGMLEKTRLKVEEARTTSLAKMEEARLTMEAKVDEWKLPESATRFKDTFAAKVKGLTPTHEPLEEEEEEDIEAPLDEDVKEAEDASLLTGLTSFDTQKSFSSLKGLVGKAADGSATLGKNVKGFASKMGDGGKEFATKFSSGGKEFATKFSSQMSDAQECGLTRPQRFRAYVILLLASTFFFGLAFQFLLLPTKFATAFSFGTVCSLAAKAMLNGPKTQLRLMFSLQKLPYTLCLLSATAATLYLTFTRANFVFVLIAAIANVAALLYYLFADTPGGKHGIKLLFKLIFNTLRLLAKPFYYAFD